jgi:hypothetical protein
MLTINEKSRQVFELHFEDENREEFIPDTVRYRLHNPSTDEELVGWVSVEPTEDTMLITIPSTANRMLNTSLAYEPRILTVQSDHDTDDQLSEELEYRIRNLSGFT